MDSEDNAKFGTVGFRFQKYFPGHGVYQGMVVEVLSGSGLLRVVYSDGDSEDLTVRDLRLLYGEWKKQSSKKSFSSSSKKKSQNENEIAPKKSSLGGASSSSTTTCNINIASKPLEFDQRIIPSIDEAAEATWKKQQPSGKESLGGSDNENDALQHEFDHALQNTARLLANGGAPSSKRNKRKRLEALPLNNSNTALVPLSCTPCGNRFGVKVFHYKDEHRRVGEILCETGHGIVEVVTVMKDLEKLRVSDLIVAPPSYAIGDCVNNYIPLPCMNGKNKGSPSKQQLKRSTSDSTTTSSSLTGGSTKQRQNQTQRPATRNNNKHSKKKSRILPKAIDPKRLASEFHWNCQHCTLKNVYNKVNCTVCRASKSNNSCTSSELLKVAENAARTARTVDEAVKAIPVDYKDRIPLQVLDVLVTCAAMIGSGSNERRCTKSRITGQDYCYSHRDDTPILSPLHVANNSQKRDGNIGDESSSTVTSTTVDRDSLPDGILGMEESNSSGNGCENSNKARLKAKNGQNCVDHELLPESAILSDARCYADALKQEQQECSSTTSTNKNKNTPCHEQLADDLQRTDALLTSAKMWHIESIEDAIFCAENDPFPLGMHVRRFFPHWGFHDGTIIKVQRQLLQRVGNNQDNNTTKSVRPVLVYRVKYDDGDQEDFTHNEICSLRQIYNLRKIPSTAHPVEQMPIGTLYLCQKDVLVKIDRHSTPRGMKEGEGGIVHVLYSQNGSPWTRTTLELIQLQLNVVCKLPPHIKNWHGSLVEDLDIVDVDSDNVKDLPVEDVELMAEMIRQSLEESSSPSTDVAAAATLNDDGDENGNNDTNNGNAKDEDEESEEIPPLNLHLLSTVSAQRSTSTVLPSVLLEWPGRGRLHANDVVALEESLRDCKDDDNNDDEDDSEEQAGDGKGDNEQQQITTWNIDSNTSTQTPGDIEMNQSLFLRRMVTTATAKAAAKRTETLTNNTEEDMNIHNNSWDPANVSRYLDWDPWHSLTCEICGHENDACRMLICDDCHKGYHMYCCRPVIVSIPTNNWTCFKCSSGGVPVRSFVEFSASMDERQACSFLKLPFEALGKFHDSHEEVLKAFETPQNNHRKQLNLPKAKSIATVKVQRINYSLRVERHDWAIPLPSLDRSQYIQSTIKIVAAMKYCGMTSYSEDLVYREGVTTEEMNNAALDSVEFDPLNKRNLEIFKSFKENLKNGSYPPITVEYDDRVGFSAVAVAGMMKHTLLMEYVGEVTTVRASEQSDSDSLMMLLDTGVPETSLIIDPSRTGNAARFLNGINNRSQFSRRKANVRTRRFVLDGKCRVALFTAKKILPGDYLTYDYNAGIEGKEGEEWAKNGFYDTSFFF